MHDDPIDSTVDQLINLVDEHPVENALAWARHRRALMIVLNELRGSTPQHPAALRMHNFIKNLDFFFFEKQH